MCVCDVGTGGVLENSKTIIKHESGYIIYIFVHDISYYDKLFLPQSWKWKMGPSKMSFLEIG